MKQWYKIIKRDLEIDPLKLLPRFLLGVFLLTAYPFQVISQTQEKWESLPWVTQAQKDYFASKAGDPEFPESANFLGGEGGQWPQGWAISSDGNTMLWGTDVGGIAYSRDAGSTWYPSNFGFSARGGIAFAIDPRNSNRAIAIGGNGAKDFVGAHGIYLTTNLNSDMPVWVSKSKVNIQGYRDIREQVTYDESSFDSSLGYCTVAYWSRGYFSGNDAETKHNGIYKTTDGGETWSVLHLDNADYNLSIIKVHPTQGYVYLANKNGFYKSIDGAVSFVNKFATPVTGLDVIRTAGHEDKVFISTADGVYISNDAGETFAKVPSVNYPTTTGTFRPASQLKVSPADPNRMLVQIEIDSYATPKYFSVDGGVTWQKSTENKDDLSVLPLNGGRFGYGLWHPLIPEKCWIFGGDFMQVSYNSGANFRWSHNGLPAIMAREFNFSTTTPGVFAIPTQDYDVAVTKDNGETWKYLNLSTYGWGGYFYGAYSSNGEVVFGIEKDPNNQSKFYISITRDGGANVTKFYSQLVLGHKMAYGDPNNPNIFFAGEYRSTDEGRTWSKMNGCDGVFTSSPTGNRELYGLLGSRKVVRSLDGGETWIPLGEFSNNIIDIAYDQLNNRIYATSSWNFYQLDISTKTITEITNRIPADQFGSRRFYQVAVDPVDPKVVYTAGANHIYANDAAVRRSVDGGLTWIPLTRAPRHNNPQFGIDGGKEGEIIRVNPLTRELIVGTNCYGTWKIGPPANQNQADLPDLRVSNISWDQQNVMEGDSVFVKIKIKNSGNTATSAGTSVPVRLLINDSIAINTDFSTSLGINEEVEITVPLVATAGNNSIVAILDADNLVAELSDDNNSQGATLVVQSAELPESPTNMQVLSKSTSNISVSWTASTEPEIAGYRVFLNGNYVNFVTGTTYNFTNLERYTEYTLTIKSVDATGTESAPLEIKEYTAARALANTVPKVSTPIIVDGDLSESAWKLDFMVAKSIDGANNNTVSYGMLWSDDSVYIAVKVLDASLHNSTTDNWKNDGVQIYINGNKSSNPVEQWYWSNDILLGKVLNNDSSLYEIWSYGDLHLNLDDVKHKTKIISGGYTMEFSIPWGKGDQFRGIGWESGFVGKKLGVDVWNIDNDNGTSRNGIKVWNGNWDNTWKGQFLGEVTLGPEGGDTTPPSIPANLLAEPGATKVNLSWASSTDNIKVVEYFIYQNGTRIGEQAATAEATQSRLITGLPQNTLFTYTIKAVDEAGNVSDFSEALQVTTLIDNDAPSVPENIVIQGTYPTAAMIAWDASTDNFGVANYIVYRDTTVVASPKVNSYKITGLNHLQSYTYRIAAVDEAGNVSQKSEPIVVVTPDHSKAEAVQAQVPVVIDGNLNDGIWENELKYNVTQNVEGVTNNNVVFGSAWDNTNLYVAVKVLDQHIFANASQFWTTDALEVYVDANQNRTATYGADDRQFTRVVNSTGTFGTGGGLQAGVSHAWGVIPGGYVMEMAIPWTNLNITPVSGMVLGFDIGNNDDDNGKGRSGVLMWNGDGNNWKSTLNFGRLELTVPVQAVTTIASPRSGSKIQKNLSFLFDLETEGSAASSAEFFIDGAKAGDDSLSTDGLSYIVNSLADGNHALSAIVTLENGTKVYSDTVAVEIGSYSGNTGKVVPILNCVRNNGDGTFSGSYGYENHTLGATVVIPAGSKNYLTPTSFQGQQTILFPMPYFYSERPGRSNSEEASFEVTFASNTNVVWNLSGRTATAGANGPICVSGNSQARFGEMLNESTFTGLLKSVYPNPVYGTSFIKFMAPENSTTKVKLFDLSGKDILLGEIRNDGEATEKQFEIHGSKLGTGVYFITLVAESKSGVQTGTGRVVIVK